MVGGGDYLSSPLIALGVKRATFHKSFTTNHETSGLLLLSGKSLAVSPPTILWWGLVSVRISGVTADRNYLLPFYPALYALCQSG